MAEVPKLHTAKFNGKPDTTCKQHNDKYLTVSPKNIVNSWNEFVYHALSFVIVLIIARRVEMNWTWQVRCQNKRFGLSKLVFAKPWNKPSYIDKKPILARQLNDWTMKTYWNYDVLCSHIANLFIHGGEEHICWTIREYKQKNRSKERLFQEYGWGNRTRTYEWRDQNPLPYQLGYTPNGAEGETWTLTPWSTGT